MLDHQIGTCMLHFGNLENKKDSLGSCKHILQKRKREKKKKTKNKRKWQETGLGLWLLTAIGKYWVGSEEVTAKGNFPIKFLCFYYWKHGGV